MKNIAIKSVTALAAAIAAFGAWAAESNKTYSNPGTDTFTSVVTSLGNYGSRFVYVGAANDGNNPFKPQTDNPYGESIWRIWRSAEDAENPGVYPYGYDLTQYPKWASLWVANDAAQYGRLKIESGVYNFARGGSNYNNMTVAGSESEGYVWQTGGSVALMDAAQPSIFGNGGTAEYRLDGGSFFSASDFFFGHYGDETTTQKIIINGGTFQCGTLTSGKWFKLGENGTGARTIDINEGGTLALCHFENYGKGTTAINLNGGTLKQLFTDSNNCKYLIGSHDHTDDGVTVTVTGDSTLDTSGKDVYIKNVSIGGTGTLSLVGGGTVTFEANPTCKITVSGGTMAMFAAGNEVPAISLDMDVIGKNDYIGFDLSSITEVGVTQTLVENWNVATEDDSPVAEHIVIRNNGVYWNVSYSENTLTATSISVLAGDWSIFTGYYDGNHPPDQLKSWVNGRPTASTRVIVPGFVGFMQMWNNLDCGSVEIHDDFRMSGASRYQHLRSESVNGEGTLTFGSLNNSDVEFAWLESLESDFKPLELNVPVVIVNASKITSRTERGSPVVFNKPFTVSSGAICEAHTSSGMGDPVFNDDVTIDGSYSPHTVLTVAPGKNICGTGTVNGSLATSEGATLKVGIGDTGVCTNVLTVTGTANLANAAIEIEGGESLADAAIGTEVVLFRANAISSWTKKTVTIGGKPWKVVVGEETIEETLYQTLKATRTKAGFMLIVQ